jgi:hypothetical protein
VSLAPFSHLLGLGLLSTGNQIWSQNTINIEETSEAGDKFGASVTGH